VIDFSALLSPEGGYRVRPRLFGDGWLACGDAMQAGSPVLREGATLALTSGRLAAETVIEVTRHGRPMSSRHLSLYRDKLERSPILSALRKIGNVGPSFDDDVTLPGPDPRRLGRAARALSRDPEDGKGRQRRLLRHLAGGGLRSWEMGGAA
jgi:electron transfer flavoprotein-quinone oxidoreductase